MRDQSLGSGLKLTGVAVAAIAMTLAIAAVPHEAYAQRGGSTTAIINEALQHVWAERYDEAERLLRPLALQNGRPRPGNDNATLQAIHSLATVYLRAHRHDEAEPLYLRLVEARESLGARAAQGAMSFTLGSAYANAAQNYRMAGRYQEAQPFLERQMEEHVRTLGSNNLTTLLFGTQLALNLTSLGRYEEAEQQYLRNIDGMRRSLGPEHETTLNQQNFLGHFYSELDRYTEAEQIYRATLESFRRTVGPDHYFTTVSEQSIALSLKDQGRFDEAEAMYLAVIDSYQRALNEARKDPQAYSSSCSVDFARKFLADVYAAQGRTDEANLLYQQALSDSQADSTPTNDYCAVSIANDVASYRLDQGQYDEAESIYRRILPRAQNNWGPDHPSTISLINNLATTLIAQGRATEAEELVRPVVELAEDRLGPNASETLSAVNNLAVSLQEQGRSAEAESLLQRVLSANDSSVDVASENAEAARINLAAIQGPSAAGSQSTSAEAAAPTCLIVTDIVIRGGEEVRMPSRMCRSPPSARWSRV